MGSTQVVEVFLTALGPHLVVAGLKKGLHLEFGTPLLVLCSALRLEWLVVPQALQGPALAQSVLETRCFLRQVPLTMITLPPC